MELKETAILNSIELRNSIVCLLQDNIIRIKIREHSIIELSDVKEIQIAKRSLIGDQKHTVLFITPRYGSIIPEAREFSASKEVNENAIAKAIVLNGLAMRIIANFFITINKPPVLHKVFETERDALRWLTTAK